MQPYLFFNFVLILDLVCLIHSIVIPEKGSNLNSIANNLLKSINSIEKDGIVDKGFHDGPKDTISSDSLNPSKVKSSEIGSESISRKGKQFMSIFPR